MVLATLVALIGLVPVQAQFPFDSEPILYSRAEPNDAISRLQRGIDAGEHVMRFEEKNGFLEGVLESLKIPVSSQVLVFSKTSFQLRRIDPQRPRAIYFNDDVYVGWCQDGDVLEVAAVDPSQGAIFYTLDQKPETSRFARDRGQCLTCHATSRTHDVPGLLVRSVHPDRSGQPVLGSGTTTTDHTSPFGERWGGWYVTGTHGDQRHMGNAFVSGKRPAEKLDVESGANVRDLTGRFDASRYLSGHSDLVALMVLEHQTQMHNLLTRANFETRSALHNDVVMNKAFGRPPEQQSPTTQRRIESAAEQVLEYMLFRGEAELTDPIQGTSGFASEFSSQGPRDRQGRSLRDLDLESRLLKYPCSYLIYSQSFRQLPAPVKERIYRRLWEILTVKDISPTFGHLGTTDRRAILEILRDTQPDLPEFWREQ